ncbi:uncharacterized protein LOC135498846 isoform X2 [Lineus longissimus]|uniref:uncharacterized protein LOC135498846 isoform X2 n=1 Tax=Lineus longissimus TaxID=88925 RepID=UPI002B4C43CA
MDGSGTHFEETVGNWNTIFDDVDAEFDVVIRSERGPGKFYDNTSPDENPEAVLDILAAGNFLEPHLRPKSPDVADFGDAQSEAENLQIDDSISECFGTTTKNRRVSRTKEQHHTERLRKTSRDQSIGGAPSNPPPGDFNKAAKTIIRDCERIQKDYDSNGQKKRAKHKGENRGFGKNVNPSVQQCDIALESASPTTGFRTNGTRASVGKVSSELDKTHVDENVTKSSHKRKIARIFRKKNDRKGQRGQRVKTPTFGSRNKGNGKLGPGRENSRHDFKLIGKNGIIDSRVTENSSFGNVPLDDRRNGTTLEVIGNAHVIEVDVPDERGRTDMVYTPLEPRDLNNNRRSGKKDLSKQLGVPGWILQEVCANLNNQNKLKSLPTPNRGSVTSVTGTPVLANTCTSGSGHDRRVEQMKKLTAENSQLTSLLSEGRVITEDMKKGWLRIDENMNRVFASRLEAKGDTGECPCVKEELQSLMNSHLESLLRLSAVLEEAEPDIHVGVNPNLSAKPIPSRKENTLGVSISTQTTESSLHPRPPKRRVPLPDRSGIYDSMYTEMSRQNGGESEDMYETLRIVEKPQIVGKVSPFRRVRQDDQDTTERSLRLPQSETLVTESLHQASLPRDTNMSIRTELGEGSKDVGRDSDQHETGHAPQRPLNRGSGTQVSVPDCAPEGSLNQGSASLSGRSSTTDSLYDRPPPLPKGRRCISKDAHFSSYNVDDEPPPLPLGRRGRKGKGSKNAVCKTSPNVLPVGHPSSLQGDNINEIVSAVCVNSAPSGAPMNRPSSYEGDDRVTRITAPFHRKTSSNVASIGRLSSLQSDDVNKIVAAVCVNGGPNGVSKNRPSSYQGDDRVTRVRAPFHSRTKSVDGYSSPTVVPSLGSFRRHASDGQLFKIDSKTIENQQDKFAAASNRAVNDSSPEHQYLALLPPSPLTAGSNDLDITNDLELTDRNCDPRDPLDIPPRRARVNTQHCSEKQSSTVGQQGSYYLIAPPVRNDTDRFPKSEPRFESFSDKLLLMPKLQNTDIICGGSNGGDQNCLDIFSDTDIMTFDDCSTCAVGLEAGISHEDWLEDPEGKPRQRFKGMFDLMERVNSKWKEIEQKYGSEAPSHKNFSLEMKNSAVENCRALGGSVGHVEALSAFMKVSTRPVGVGEKEISTRHTEGAVKEVKSRTGGVGVKEVSSHSRGVGVKDGSSKSGGVGVEEGSSKSGGIGVKRLSSQSAGAGVNEVSSQSEGVGVKEVSSKSGSGEVKEVSSRLDEGMREVKSQPGGLRYSPGGGAVNERSDAGFKSRSTSGDYSSDAPRMTDSSHSGRGGYVEVDPRRNLSEKLDHKPSPGKKKNGHQDSVVSVATRGQMTPESSSRRRRSRSRRRQSSDIQSSQDSDFADKSELSSDEEATSSGTKRSTRVKVSKRKMINSSSCESGIKVVAPVAKCRFGSTGNDIETSDMSSIEGKAPRPPRRKLSEDSLTRKKAPDRTLEPNVRRMSEVVIRRPDNPSLTPGIGMVRSKGNFCLNRISGDEGESKSRSIGHASHRNHTLGMSDKVGNSNELRKPEGDISRGLPPRNTSVLRASYSQIKEIYEGKKRKSSVAMVTAKQSEVDAGLQKPEVLEQKHSKGREVGSGKEQRLVLNKVYDSSDLSSGDENKPWYEHSDEEVLILDESPRIVNKDNSIYGIPSDMLVTFF